MASINHHDPDQDNLLTRGLGPNLSRSELAKKLTELPLPPPPMDGVPPHVAMRWVTRLRKFYIPSLEVFRLFESIDLAVRENYSYRNPALASTWTIVSGVKIQSLPKIAPPFCVGAVGLSGTGKSEAIKRCLRCYPGQVFLHETFPKLVGPHRQLPWISIDVAPGGHSVDTARSLMIEFDRVLECNRFANELSTKNPNGMKMLDVWRQVASAHFLGLLHLDEIQNLFKLATLRRRRGKIGETSDPPELSIVEDQLLKWILTLLNTWQVPLLVSGTPDGFGALSKRMSTAGRIANSGSHVFRHFDDFKASEFRKNFLPVLGRYQFVRTPLAVNDELADLLIELTGGIQRFIIAIWIAAHRVALERNKGDLLLSDFRKAADTLLAPIGPAVAALRSRDPARMSKFEDLVPRNDAFWSHFWQEVGGA